MKRVIVLGATSAIAEAAARIWAAEGASVTLVARNAPRLESIAADLKLRGAAEVATVELDCAGCDVPAEFDRLVQLAGAPDVVLLAYGVLGDQAQSEADPEAAARLFRTNFTSAAAWCLAAADLFERQRRGVLVVIGSVAGDRGRRSNYVYGASKAGIAALVEGISHRLASRGGHAVLVKPGFVDTPMTAAITPKGLLWAQPEAVGRIIVKAAAGRAPVVYAPAFWRAIMLVIRNIPPALFHKTRL